MHDVNNVACQETPPFPTQVVTLVEHPIFTSVDPPFPWHHVKWGTGPSGDTHVVPCPFPLF